MTDIQDREKAFSVLCEYTKTESLIRHALTVEAVMAYFARLHEQTDVLTWQIIGLLHDIDYEMYPDQHCHKAREILIPHGYSEEVIRAVESHGYLLVSDVEPKTLCEKVLYATDELTGLIAATALMRPSKSVLDLEVSSVMKKWKQKSFAVGVNREVIQNGADMLGMPLDELMHHTILSMRTLETHLG